MCSSGDEEALSEAPRMEWCADRPETVTVATQADAWNFQMP